MKRANKCVGKRAFYTTRQALNIARAIYNKKRVKLRYYECPTCLDFHLTKSHTDRMGDIYNQWDREYIYKLNASFEILFYLATRANASKPQKKKAKNKVNKLNISTPEKEEMKAMLRDFNALFKHVGKVLPLNDQKKTFELMRFCKPFTYIDYNSKLLITALRSL